MRYYDKFCWPSWAAYADRTQDNIDLTIDINIQDGVLHSTVSSSPMINGGIDLNPEMLSLITNGHNIQYVTPIDFNMLGNMPVKGFTPVIIQITPISSNLIIGATKSKTSPIAVTNKIKLSRSDFIKEYREKYLSKDHMKDVEELFVYN